MMNFDREIWEGWTARNFIDAMKSDIAMIMAGGSIHKPFKTKLELETYLLSNQPYYKKKIPEVIEYFSNKYGLS